MIDENSIFNYTFKRCATQVQYKSLKPWEFQPFFVFAFVFTGALKNVLWVLFVFIYLMATYIAAHSQQSVSQVAASYTSKRQH